MLTCLLCEVVNLTSRNLVAHTYSVVTDKMRGPSLRASAGAVAAAANTPLPPESFSTTSRGGIQPARSSQGKPVCIPRPPSRETCFPQESAAVLEKKHQLMYAAGPVQSLESKGELALWLVSALQVCSRVIS